MNISFVFNSPKEQEKKKKTDLQAIGEKVTSFFGMSPLSMVSKCAKVSKICPLKL